MKHKNHKEIIELDNNDFEVIGSGGGKSGSNSPPKEAPESLRSVATVAVVEALSEGPVEGIPDGLKGVFFDNTPVQAQSGDFNFPNIRFEERRGEPGQEYIPGFPDVESAIAVNTQLPNPPNGVTRSLTAAADAARLVVTIPTLIQVDTETGDTSAAQIPIAIDVRVLGGTWQQIFSKNITGVTRSPYQEAYRVESPQVGTAWDVRIRRLNNVSTGDFLKDDISLSVVVELQDIKLAYEDTAHVGILIDSESTGGQVPTRSYQMKGMKVAVPSTYNPTQIDNQGNVLVNASYDSPTWSGTFAGARQWCDDPAWILYDILTNNRYGFGEFISEQDIDIFSFFEASKYNTELVSDGNGGQENRFRFNSTIMTQEDNFKLLQSIASTFRAQIINTGGKIKLIQDRPTETSAILTHSNVIDGTFSYSATEMSARPTAVEVTFNDINDHFLPRAIIEEASTAEINAFGYNKKSIQAVGITRESEARRLALWALLSGLRNAEVASFQVSFSNAFLEVGEVVEIADNFFANAIIGGTIQSGSSGNVLVGNFDPSEDISSATSVKYILTDGTEVNRNIISVNGNEITLETGQDLSQLINLPFILFGNVVPRPFLITGISESSTGVYDIKAVEYDDTKFTSVDTGIIIDNNDQFQDFGPNDIEKPTGDNAFIEAYSGVNGETKLRLIIEWNDVSNTNLAFYRVKYRRNGGPYVWSGNLSQSRFVLEDIDEGVFEYHIHAFNVFNTQSPSLDGYIIGALIEGQPGDSDLAAPTNVRVKHPSGSTTPTDEFTGTEFTLTWDPVSSVETSQFRDYKVNVLNDLGETIAVETVEGTEITFGASDIAKFYFGENNTPPDGKPRILRFEVFARDISFKLSLGSGQFLVNRPAPPVLTNVTAAAAFDNYKIKHDDHDGEGIIIHHIEGTFGIVPSPNNIVKDDQGTNHLVEGDASTNYNWAVACYDSWSKFGLNYVTGTVTTETQIIDEPDPVPGGVSGLSVTSSLQQLDTGEQKIRLNIVWNVVADANSYDLWVIEQSTNNTTIVSIPPPDDGESVVRYTMDALPNVQYTVRVRSRIAGEKSAWAGPVNHTTTGDLGAPGAPSGLNVVGGFESVFIEWTNPTDSDLKKIEIQRRQTAPFFTSFIKIADISAPNTFYFDNQVEIGNTYQYRITAVDSSGNTSNTVATNQVIPRGLGENSITETEITPGSITSPLVGTNLLISSVANIGTGVINNAAIQDAAISSAKIQNASINSLKLTGNIQSDNYSSANKTGWRIRRDTGDAEFNQIDARGSVTVGDTGPTGTNVRVLGNHPDYLLWGGTGDNLTDEDAVFFIKRDGSSFFGGDLKASVINTFVSTNNLTSANPMILGPIDTFELGAALNYTFAFTYTQVITGTSTCPASPTHATGTLTLERSVDGGSTWSQISSQSYDVVPTCIPDAENNRHANIWSVNLNIDTTDTNTTATSRLYRLNVSNQNIVADEQRASITFTQDGS